MSNLRVGTVVFDSVSKRYRLGALGTLRDTLAALTSRARGDDEARELWALRDVSFRVEAGESLGLIGPNGAGKTTALKLLSKITQPTTGCIQVSGRTSSLIELGAGFHPELTGRENIYLNGAILGLRQREIADKFDDIVAFSELERFLDTPVKRYSSGMYVRLGFAVAAHVEPDVLLVDEVLAVGDASFRQRCLDRMNRLMRQGTTIVFVSHNMYLVRRLCKRALLLDNGEPRYLGPANDGITMYENLLTALPGREAGFAPEDVSDAGAGLMVTGVTVSNESGQSLQQVRYDENVVVRVAYRTFIPIRDPIVKMRLLYSDGTVAAMMASRYQAGTTWTLSGGGVIIARIEPIQLATGTYHVEARIIDATDSQVLASGQSTAFHVAGPSLAHEVDRGVFVPHVRWDHGIAGGKS